MNLHEIVNRPFSQILTQQEALYVIMEYIRIRKGVVITPRVSPFTLDLMCEMTTIALCWLKNNRDLI